MKFNVSHALFSLSLLSLAGVAFQPHTAQAAMIVVDFGPDGSTTGTNWNQITPTFTSLSNLIDVNGNSTGASFMLAPGSDAPDSFESGDPPAAQIPTNSPITTDIGGNITGFLPVDYWFKGLNIRSLYKIYVFSYRSQPYFNQITVETQQTIPSYAVTGDQQLYVNRELGTDTRTLETYTDIVSVWDSGPNVGGIGLTIDLNADADFDGQWAIAGIAIEEIPVPEPSNLLGLGLIGGGIILRSLKKR